MRRMRKRPRVGKASDQGRSGLLIVSIWRHHQDSNVGSGREGGKKGRGMILRSSCFRETSRTSQLANGGPSESQLWDFSRRFGRPNLRYIANWTDGMSREGKSRGSWRGKSGSWFSSREMPMTAIPMTSMTGNTRNRGSRDGSKSTTKSSKAGKCSRSPGEWSREYRKIPNSERP